VPEYVRQGHGVGLTAQWSGYPGDSDLWWRPMDRWFDGVSVCAVTKSSPKRQELVHSFLEILRRRHDAARPKKKGR
jgi:hypothetical protein